MIKYWNFEGLFASIEEISRAQKITPYKIHYALHVRKFSR